MLTYCTGVRALHDWAALSNVDPTFTKQPAGYDPALALFDHRVTSFLNFLGHLAHAKLLVPQTIVVYKSAVSNWFRSQFLAHEFTTHPVVAQLMGALNIQYRTINSVATTRRLPFTLQMLIWLEKYVLDMRKSMDRATLIAVKISLILLLRKSEIIPDATDHFLRENDVTFLMKSAVSGELHFHCPARNADRFELKNLLGVTVFVRSAKNDQDGEGHQYHFDVLNVSVDALFCLASDMFVWAQAAKLQHGDPFVGYRGDGPENACYLSYPKMLNSVKEAATGCGFDPKRFGTHSLRIGGATILAAAGMPNHYISKLGRWKSLAFLNYIHMALGVMDTSLKALVNPKWFTNLNLKLLSPGVAV